LAQALAPTATYGLVGRIGQYPRACMAAGLLLLALLLRSAWFGDPLAGYDEQFYLLVGERMLRGALPYVDLWDRKPLGLFLIYAGIRLTGGDPVLHYQLAAAASVAATGFVIALHVRRHYPDPTAFACGALYVLWTGVMGGEDAQSPLFYNLPVAIAAYLVLEAVSSIDRRSGIARATIAMALCGLALTIKTTVVFEACLFGLTLVAARLRACGLSRTIAPALIWLALGILPFAAIGLFYAHIGEFDAFWFANARSAGLRTDGWHPRNLWGLLQTLAALAPLLFLAFAATRDDRPTWERRFNIRWIVAAAMGFLAVGYFFHHYALPLLVPLTIAAAPFLLHARHRTLALALFVIFPATQQLVLHRLLVRPDRADAAALAAAIPPQVTRECMLIYGGPPILFHLTDACVVSRFIFPDHLFSAAEAPALGTDQAKLVADALARRPAAIVRDWPWTGPRRSRRSDALVAAALAQGYHLRATCGWRQYETGRTTLQIWQRSDLPVPAGRPDRC